jgi:pimeloyl-ACP methyl ester carboxylesterase
MVVQGLADPYGTVAQVHAAGYRAQGVMLEGVGHSPHLEAPEVVLEDITAFCNRLAKAA